MVICQLDTMFVDLFVILVKLDIDVVFFFNVFSGIVHQH